MPKPLTLPQKLERFPPVVIRLLAREPKPGLVGGGAFGGMRALSDPEIASRAALSVGEVRTLSKLTSWQAVDVGTMQSFIRGCGADLDDRDWLRKNAAYMASIRSIPRYLRQSPDWSTTFEPLIGIWVRHAQAA